MSLLLTLTLVLCVGRYMLFNITLRHRMVRQEFYCHTLQQDRGECAWVPMGVCGVLDQTTMYTDKKLKTPN